MGKRSTVSSETAGEMFSQFDGFEDGYNKRHQIIKLGELLRKLREDEVKLNQSDAAKLINMEQSELSRIENGYGELGPSFTTIALIVEAYKTYLSKKGTDLTLSIEVSTAAKHKSSYSLISEKGDVLEVD